MVSKIVLVGYMGVGKTTIGTELARKTNLKFLDLDELIEKKENKTIEEIFSQKGELYFRKIEHQLFEELINNDTSFVLSTGGGTPCYFDNYLYLENENVNSVYLNATINTIYNRLINVKKQRPLISEFTTLELNEFIGKHLFERSYYYLKAKIQIKVEDKSIEVVCDEIIKNLF